MLASDFLKNIVVAILVTWAFFMSAQIFSLRTSLAVMEARYDNLVERTYELQNRNEQIFQDLKSVDNSSSLLLANINLIETKLNRQMEILRDIVGKDGQP